MEIHRDRSRPGGDHGMPRSASALDVELLCSQCQIRLGLHLHNHAPTAAMEGLLPAPISPELLVSFVLAARLPDVVPSRARKCSVCVLLPFLGRRCSNAMDNCKNFSSLPFFLSPSSGLYLLTAPQ
ncbi:hypothetical protein ACQJBY_033872 [Aegilops geniculata]